MPSALDITTHAGASASGHTDVAPPAFAEYFKILAENINDIVWIYDITTDQAQYISPAFEPITGRSPHALKQGLHQSMLGWIHPTDRQLFETARQRQRNGESTDINYRIMHANGSERWLRTKASAIADETGRVHRVVGITRDITERQQMKINLRRNEKRLRRMVDHLPAGAAYLSGKHLIINKTIQNITGYTRRDIKTVADWFDKLFANHDQRQQARQRYRNAQITQFAQAIHLPIVCKDGDERIIEMTGYTDDLIELWLINDITERYHNERALIESEEHYRRVADTNRRLVAEINHRVRNNLANLLSIVRMTRQSTNSDDFTRTLEHRILAMSQVHNLLAQSGWHDVLLQTLITNLLVCCCDGEDHHPGIHLSGPKIMLKPRQIMPTAMIIAELLTNSVKHGALRATDGQLHIAWHTRHHNHRPAVRIRWKETGGPTITAPPKPGLGTELIHGFIHFQLEGQCKLRYPPEGVCHLLDIPLLKTET